jgi:hypothetical protein
MVCTKLSLDYLSSVTTYHFLLNHYQNSFMMVAQVTPIADSFQFGNHPFHKYVADLLPLW